ncbi:MAG: SDR family NAD(P)-dependent oxidoreductase [Polyangiales bacterium]|nr:SDR family NAD(P)-dependent oxidoreductase [Myxococcales bacterium]MCB9660685.1 SDR family NAD(P)-dependent oxidoreductase [Sandaracinaceae bacterium]
MNLNDTVALVTGGASGLGEATARRFVAAGAKVVVVDLDADRGEALSKELAGQVTYVKGNVADPDDVARAVAAAESVGPLRVAVSCAGIGVPQKTVGRDGEPHDLAAFQKVITVNLVGTFNVLRLAAASMSKNEPLGEERGVVINTASIAAFDGQIGQVAYAASKGGVVALTLPAARDLMKNGVRVMTIAPGLFKTPLLLGLPEPALASLGASVPNPSRLGDPSEYARLAQHIVENAYLNGEVIRIDAALRMAPR